LGRTDSSPARSITSVFNLKAAKELGLTVSRDLLLVADDVVE
jgi:hypothetical protein